MLGTLRNRLVPSRAKNDFCCSHVVFEHPGQWTAQTRLHKRWKRTGTFLLYLLRYDVSERTNNTGESFSDSA